VNWKYLKLIALGLVLWGGIHAYGAYLLNHNPWRAVVTSLFTAGFVLFWGVLLYSARHRFARQGRAYAQRVEQRPVRSEPGSKT
jgi:hypothetical protein